MTLLLLAAGGCRQSGNPLLLVTVETVSGRLDGVDSLRVQVAEQPTDSGAPLTDTLNFTPPAGVTWSLSSDTAQTLGVTVPPASGPISLTVIAMMGTRELGRGSSAGSVQPPGAGQQVSVLVRLAGVDSGDAGAPPDAGDADGPGDASADGRSSGTGGAGGMTAGGVGGSGVGGSGGGGGASGAGVGGSTGVGTGGAAGSGTGGGAGGAATGGRGGAGAGGSGTGGATGSGGATGTGGAAGAAACATTALADRVRVSEIDVGVTYAYNEVDSNGAGLGLTPLAISPLPGGGSRLAFLGKSDGTIHVVQLDAGDQVVAGSAFGLPGYDFQDIYADAAGGTLLISRAALGSTLNNNCGDINNLCGLTSNYPTAASCYDMYMVRFDGAAETWAAKLTDTTATLPAYGTSATSGGNVIFIWSEYAHNGRIAFDGANYAGYFGAAITVPNQTCVGSSTLPTGVNIHQGDRMKVVSGGGASLASPGFSFGCSHSGYERVIWDGGIKQFVPVCKNDAATAGKSGRIAFAPTPTTIYAVDTSYSDLGSVILARGGAYWIITSDIRAGQTANANGLADVHLLHVPSLTNASPDNDITLVSDGLNDRAPHLVPSGGSQLLAVWESSTATGDLSQNTAGRQMYLQILDSTTGAAPAGSSATTAGPLKLTPNVLGSRYQDFRAYPDGSAAYPAPGSAATKIKILRVLPCAP